MEKVDGNFGKDVDCPSICPNVCMTHCPKGYKNPGEYTAYFTCCDATVGGVLCTIYAHYTIRRDFKEKYGMTDYQCRTCLEAFFCMPCAYEQMIRHVEAYPLEKIDPDNFIDENKDSNRMERGCSVPAMKCCERFIPGLASTSPTALTDINVEQNPKAKANSKKAMPAKEHEDTVITIDVEPTKPGRSKTGSKKMKGAKDIAHNPTFTSGDGNADSAPEETFGGFEDGSSSTAAEQPAPQKKSSKKKKKKKKTSKNEKKAHAEWNAMRLTKEEALQKIEGGKPGSFVIRASNSAVAVLSMIKPDSKLYNRLIEETPSGFCLAKTPSQTFPSLDGIAQHYTTPAHADKGGLPCPLLHASVSIDNEDFDGFNA